MVMDTLGLILGATMKKVIAVIGFLFTATTFAASFDCSKAGTQIEKAICSYPELSALDEQLASAYRAATVTAADQSQLKQGQRTWITQVRDKCEDTSCLALAYQNRINDLTGNTSNQPLPVNEQTTASQPQIIQPEPSPPQNTTTTESATQQQEQRTTEISQQTERIAKIAQEEKEKAEQQKSESLKNNFFIILAVVGGAWVWHKFIRRRCPSCKATSPDLINTRELDSWLGTKKVTENLGNGKSRERVVNTTFSKVERTYKCTSCGNQWVEVSKEEKK